jgi:hypothetical protein
VMLLAALLIPVLWIVWSYFSIRRWQHHGELPPRGISRFWRLYLPLAIDFCPVVLAWIIVPAQFHAPMETIALFAPDVFVVIITLTALSCGWAMARTVLTLHPRGLLKQPSR